ncbi:hypothetical protein [Butyrivibrio sp. AE2015]|uniref:hypothetical protein n=1 Tax=Butyrivibrio sp. AE2015 TaxID=1280663 RepID=UPI0003B6007E|nr:hypothetical protein [Butyrivibrio sp. AE2015]
MSKGYTEIVYILDRSGSMGGLEADTIGGFNAMMEKQKKTGEKAVVSTVLFDDECEVIHDRVPIEKIEKMVKKQQKKYGWESIFIGANIDAYAEAQKYGIRKDRAVNYVSDTIGTANVYAGVSKAVCSVMMAGSAMEADECLSESGWDDEINRDYQKRGKSRWQ